MIETKTFIIRLPLFAFLILLNSCTPKPLDLTQYVDPLSGTGDHGHVFIGAGPISILKRDCCVPKIPMEPSEPLLIRSVLPITGKAMPGNTPGWCLMM